MSLSVAAVSKSFGATHALVGVSMTFAPGSVEGLIGENGAGKSTLIKILAGVEAADAGEVLFDGLPMRVGSPAAARRAGIAVVHQNPQWVDALDVLDNLHLGRADFSAAAGWIDRAALRRRAQRVLDRYGYTVPLDGLGRDLTPAARTLLALTRGLLDTPRLLILDEPTASLGHAEVALLKRVMDRLVAAGCAVLFVSHRLEEVLAFAHHVTVMRNGQVVARVDAVSQTRASLIGHLSGNVASDAARDAAGDAHDRSAAGGDAGKVDATGVPAASTGPAPTPEPTPLLEVDALSTADGRVAGVSLRARRGEVVVLYGLAGAGRTELLEAVYGLRRRGGGSVRLAGRPLDGSIRQALDRGVRLVPEDRKGQALIAGASVRDNLHLGQWQRWARGGVVDAAGEAAHAQLALSRFSIRASGPMQPVAELSGGNQQKVVFARTSAEPVALMLCDEPTQAVDVGTRRAIHALIRAHADAGGAAVVATSDVEELMALADSVVVMCEGRVAARFDGRPFQRDAILQACFPAERAAAPDPMTTLDR